MKTLKMMLLGSMLLVLLTGAAQAHLILFDYYAKADGPANSDPITEAAWIEAELGLAGLTFLGRAIESGGVEGDPLGLLANGNIVVSGYVDSDDDDALVSWNLAGTGYEMVAVLLKDGQPAGLSLYTVSADQVVSSMGSELVNLNPAAEGRGGLSHISFFGRAGGKEVPDGGLTVVMLGFALAAVGFISRRIG